MRTPKTLCEGRYKVTTKPGSSAYATVYECYDRVDDDAVAVKVLHLSRATGASFARCIAERSVPLRDLTTNSWSRCCAIKKRKKHSGSVSSSNSFLEASRWGRCRDRATRRPVITARWRIRQMRGILNALNRVYGRSIVHRDVKPSNLLFSREEAQLKLSDFGIARLLENYGRGDVPATLREFYTRPYAAPEQVLRRDTSFPADLHAFGGLLAAILAWRHPPAEFEAAEARGFLEPFRGVSCRAGGQMPCRRRRCTPCGVAGCATKGGGGRCSACSGRRRAC